MRNSFAKKITEIADKDKSVRLLVGDIGFRIFDKYIENHSSSFINCGIAEQNMVSENRAAQFYQHVQKLHKFHC